MNRVRRFLKLRELIDDHSVPEFGRITARLLIIFFIFSLMFMLFVPWQQTTEGEGRVVAYLPSERIQDVHAPVSGRIHKWYVREGSFVKKGDPILEIKDIDPQYLERLKIEMGAISSKYEAAQAVTLTSKKDLERQEALYQRKYSSQKDLELASIAHKNALSAEAQARADVVRMETKISRQKTQLVLASRDGTVVRLIFGTNSVIVKEGEVVAVFVPASAQLASEIFINGNDLPLIYVGRKVRLQFQGWPAVQFSGWPATAVGTFSGEVAIVDQTADTAGRFRVMVVQDQAEGAKPWPKERYIRQGTKVVGWVLLGQVSVGYEIWRQFNGFPLSMDKDPEAEQLGLKGNL